MTFADKTEPQLWEKHEEILVGMDLKGEYQSKNLRTALAALTVMSRYDAQMKESFEASLRDAIVNTAKRTGFRGRWEKFSEDPYMICDIGHNEHGLKYNFAQLKRMMESGEFSKLIIVYGSVADKDVDAALRHLPKQAVCVFTQANSKRALAAEKIKEKYLAYCSQTSCGAGEIYVATTVSEALALSAQLVAEEAAPLIYIGGSTYIVSEAVANFKVQYN